MNKNNEIVVVLLIVLIALLAYIAFKPKSNLTLPDTSRIDVSSDSPVTKKTQATAPTSQKLPTTTEYNTDITLCNTKAELFFNQKNQIIGGHATYVNHYSEAQDKCLVLITNGSATNNFNAVLWNVYSGEKLAQYAAPFGMCEIKNISGCTFSQYQTYTQAEMNQ